MRRHDTIEALYPDPPPRKVEYRGRVSDFWALDPAIVHLNHGSFGACPRPVMAAQQRLRDQLEAQPTGFMAGLEARLDAVRAAVGDFAGADPEDLAFVPNATTGVNAVLRSLRFEPGDELLTTDHAYHACANALRFVAERTGARVVVVPVPFPLEDPAEVTAAILGAVTERTRLALVDHITSPTALILPIEDIARGLAGRGVELLVDGAHAPGMVPLDLRALSCTYYTGNLHKRVCAPRGAAFLHVRRDRQPEIRPVAISHGADTRRTDRSRYLVEFDWTGTHDPTAILAVPAALGAIASLSPDGWAGVMRDNRSLALAARDLLCATLGVRPPAPDTMIGAIASVPLPDSSFDSGLSVDMLQLDLVERHRIQCLVPYWPAAPRRLVRVSAQRYTTLEHVQALARALAAELG